MNVRGFKRGPLLIIYRPHFKYRVGNFHQHIFSRALFRQTETPSVSEGSFCFICARSLDLSGLVALFLLSGSFLSGSLVNGVVLSDSRFQHADLGTVAAGLDKHGVLLN